MDVETRNISIKTPDGSMPAHVARPKGASGKLPAVIVVQEAFGLNENIKQIAGRIAAEGYQAVAPNFYYREGGKVVGYGQLQDAIGLMTRWGDAQIVADVRATVAALEADSAVRGDRIGITGFCMGGRVSYLSACEIPAIRVAVPFYGGGIAGQQFGPGASAPVSQTAKMRAAIQLHFGEKDAFIPLAAVEEIRQALQRENKDFEVHVYKGAGHGFFCAERADYNEEAAKLAWERTKAFLKKHLQ
ncbi:MAG TPA: dienelactone hydrolase family protein [Candidatus Binatia bacterium]|nr:dienelactone hydrolase family protein [Candidatus Binatia bacterium]